MTDNIFKLITGKIETTKLELQFNRLPQLLKRGNCPKNGQTFARSKKKKPRLYPQWKKEEE